MDVTPIVLLLKPDNSLELARDAELPNSGAEAPTALWSEVRSKKCPCSTRIVSYSEEGHQPIDRLSSVCVDVPSGRGNTPGLTLSTERFRTLFGLTSSLNPKPERPVLMLLTSYAP